MGERREVSIISHRPVTRSDLKQERSFFRGSVSTSLQLVVATCYLFENLKPFFASANPKNYTVVLHCHLHDYI